MDFTHQSLGVKRLFWSYHSTCVQGKQLTVELCSASVRGTKVQSDNKGSYPVQQTYVHVTKCAWWTPERLLNRYSICAHGTCCKLNSQAHMGSIWTRRKGISCSAPPHPPSCELATRCCYLPCWGNLWVAVLLWIGTPHGCRLSSQ